MGKKRFVASGDISGTKINKSKDLFAQIKRPHPDEHLTMRFPAYLHHEENRQAFIRYWNFHHPGGWLPCGDNWWQFPASEHRLKKMKENHEATNQRLRDMGFIIHE